MAFMPGGAIVTFRQPSCCANAAILGCVTTALALDQGTC